MHIVQPAHSVMTDVISLADMKLFLRVDASDEDDVITALGNAAVAWCENYCNRRFTSQSTIFYLSHFRAATLAFGPVTSIESVSYDDTSGTQQTLSSDKYYTQQPHDGSIMIYFHDVPDLQDYNAHPVRVRTTVGATEKQEVVHAVQMLVAHWYESRRTVVTGTIATSIPFAVEALLSSQRILDMRQ